MITNFENALLSTLNLHIPKKLKFKSLNADKLVPLST